MIVPLVLLCIVDDASCSSVARAFAHISVPLALMSPLVPLTLETPMSPVSLVRTFQDICDSILASACALYTATCMYPHMLVICADLAVL